MQILHTHEFQESESVMWETWFVTEQRTLVRYANPLTVRLMPQLPKNPIDLYGDPDGNLRTLALIYETLRDCGIHYALEPVSYEQGEQYIREPVEILRSPQQGTCLDLAVLFAGACMAYDLLPLIVVVKGHSLIAVSRTQYRRDVVNGRRDELRLFEEGLLPKEKIGKLREWIDQGRYVALECTGVAFTEASGNLPERLGRENGLMSFCRATRAGREQLDVDKRPFLYALDVHELQRRRRPYPIEGIEGYNTKLHYDVEQALSKLHVKLAVSRYSSRVATLKLRSLESRLDALEEEYEAVTKAIEQTIDPITLVRLERQGQSLLEQMKRIETELVNLG